MRRCLHLTHKAFSCIENSRKLVPLVNNHKKVCGTMGWEFSLDLLMDIHSLLQSLHQQKWVLTIVMAKRIMKWWVPIKLCELASCYAQVAITNTQSVCTPHDDLHRNKFKWSFPVKKRRSHTRSWGQYKTIHQESRDNDDHTNGPSSACALVRHKSAQEGIRESDDQNSRGVHKIN